MKRYEQSVRVITAFFSVLLGFGLKALLDEASKGDGVMPAGTLWPCFFASTFLFLRFLVGSNNHMWREYVFPDGKADTNFQASKVGLLRDFTFLIIFGFFGVGICYARSLDTFLRLNLALLFFALIWVFVGVIYTSAKGRGSATGVRTDQRRWWFWRWINLAQVAVVCVVIYFQNGLAAGSWTGPCWLSSLPPLNGMWLLAVCYAVLLLWDLWEQFEVLESAKD
jgi:hypothetical protein